MIITRVYIERWASRLLYVHCTQINPLNPIFAGHLNPPQASMHWTFYYQRDTMLPRYLLSLRLRPSICPSVTSQYCINTAKRRVSKTMPHDSLGYLVLKCKRSLRNSDGNTPNRGAKCKWGRQKWRFQRVEKSPAQMPYHQKCIHPPWWSVHYLQNSRTTLQLIHSVMRVSRQ